LEILGHSHLKAIFEENSSHVNRREEGAGTEITLIDDIVTFDYEAKSTHPEIIWLLCWSPFP